jgi:hypothetical protein
MIVLAPGAERGAMVLGSVTYVLTYVILRFRNISRKPQKLFQPYYTHMIPTCPRCACWGVRPSEGQKKVEEGLNLSCRLRSISRKALDRFQPYFTRSPHAIDVPFGVYDLLEGQRRSKEGRRRS